MTRRGARPARSIEAGLKTRLYFVLFAIFVAFVS